MYNLTKYYNTNSIIHNINPLCKIICILIFTILVLLSNNILFLIILSLLLLLYMISSLVPIGVYFKNVKYIMSFILFILIINLIFNTIYGSIISIMKLLLLLFYSLVVIYTTKSNDLIYGLEQFLSPLKLFGINTGVLSLTISLALRFIPTIFEQGYKVYKSQISRGLNFNGSLKNKINKLMSLIIPIFDLSLKRSENLSLVLDTRLYRVGAKRSNYKLKSLSIIDENILLIHILVLILFIIVEVIL